MNRDFIEAMSEIEKEKGIPQEALFAAVEKALTNVYKRQYGAEQQNVRIDMDRETGDISIQVIYEIVDGVEDEMTQVDVEEAKEIDPAYEVGDEIAMIIDPKEFSRIATNQAKGEIIQQITEAERDIIYKEFIGKQGEIINGKITRMSKRAIYVNVGRAEGALPENEQVPGEKYRVYDRIKVYIMDVKNEARDKKKGKKEETQIFLSRSHPGLVKKLFELEVPEIQDGTVEIKSIAREAGSRTKIAVYTEDENVDPVGACVGNRGSRVQRVVDELFGEKIDIIMWSDDPEELIKNVLSPATVEAVIIDEEEKSALAVVPDSQLSLAIGNKGQNVRLAAKLCSWKIDIKSVSQYEEMFGEEDAEELPEEEIPEAEEAEAVVEAAEEEKAEEE